MNRDRENQTGGVGRIRTAPSRRGVCLQASAMSVDRVSWGRGGTCYRSLPLKRRQIDFFDARTYVAGDYLVVNWHALRCFVCVRGRTGRREGLTASARVNAAIGLLSNVALRVPGTSFGSPPRIKNRE